MKPAPFNLHLPGTVQDTLRLLAGSSNARVIAGGQSLMPMLNLRLAMPDDVIDLNGVEGLSYIRQEGQDIAIGAMTRQRDLEFSALVRERLPVLHAAILNVGHRQTRNRGTIGGSLCHMDPSAELPTMCVLLDAHMVIQSQRGRREVPAREFGLGLMTTSLAADELLTEIRLRPWRPGHGWHFVEYARRHGDFAVASASALVERDADGRLTRAALALGGVCPAPVRLPEAERLLVEGNGDRDALRAAADQARLCDALEDPAYPAWYRQRLASRLLHEAMEQALARAAGTHGSTE
ncbi:molybdopterin dehydrogenase [Bordetella genomosp. 9]|uniref:Molybdopterin dehydrogenase n=1 Tax=Bordetella genomosp. 9 TaxID=1416803 RepID=A0A261R411_9BORD|nr:xanthine dehydrogenase family protein subunit M [Bordetella genomosp. 9]OZI19053.1 molybdopterin dehydrogenase [Bordetella genomosp. 9]